MYQFPSFLEELIFDYLKKTYRNSKLKTGKVSFRDSDFEFFSKGAAKLSEAYTEDRGSLPINYLNDPVLRSGYLLYFLPVNFLKIVRILNEFHPSEMVNGAVRVLDLGSGPGTNMLGFMSFYAEALKKKMIKEGWLDFTLVDLNYPALKEARIFHDAYKQHLEADQPGFKSSCFVKNFDLHKGPVKRLLSNMKYHYIIISNFLNELPNRQEQIELITELMQNHLDPKSGKLIIIEPALKKTSRDLQHLRDEIVVTRKIGFAQSPCLHQNVCPLNVINQRDWCHFYLPWECPPFISKVDKMIGNKKEWLAMSYLVLGLQERDFTPLFKQPQKTWRVISNLMHTKGKKEVVLCGPGGRIHLQKQDKNNSSVNEDFNRIQRGDWVELASNPTLAKFQIDGRGEVAHRDSIKVVKKF